ncbi:MAG: TerC family protein [Myxococcales bacterium]|nr:TerC family protein [Myxococcales bacterium]
MSFDVWLQPENWLALLSLTALEIVLGIDNIVFIAVLAGKLPAPQQGHAYRLGLTGALITRVLLLLALSWIMRLSQPLFALLGNEFSGRDLILVFGGVFLLAKSTFEIYGKVESVEAHELHGSSARGLAMTVVQIMILDIVFSLDSVITAVGMSNQIEVMISAIVIAVIVMLIFAKSIGDFVNRYPSMQILALSFLLLIGVLLVADGFGQHVSKGYIYFAMGFSLLVELINLRYRKKVRVR